MPLAAEDTKSALNTKATEKTPLAAKDAGLSDKPATKKTPAMPRMKAAQPKSMRKRQSGWPKPEREGKPHPKKRMD
jgi:hypothetical protein